MINFINKDKWIILQYRPAAGGKFLCAALLSIDCIAHWDPLVEKQEKTFHEWADQQWSTDKTKWLSTEPLHQWDIRFFSRTYPRGENLTIEESNALANQSSEYFKKVWHTDKRVLDFIHKKNYPALWKDAFTIKLDARINCPIHRKMLLSKIYPYNPKDKSGMFMMDHPGGEDISRSANAAIYKNKYKYENIQSEQQWYEFIWSTDQRLNFEINNADLYLDDLFYFSKVNNFIKLTSQRLNSNYNKEHLKYIWDVWINKNIDLLPK